MKIPRLVLAGTHSGVGKTTLATGLMAALEKGGQPVQGFKVGPDYIDPGYHKAATGRPSRNLDRWLLGERLPRLFAQNAKDCWAVIEGVMGLFDGMSGTPGFGSTADVAKILSAPVILIVDEPSMSRSVAALVHGYHTYDPALKLQGVILNRVKSAAQEKILREALQELQMPVLGVLPKEVDLQLPERHLGLRPAGESGQLAAFLERLVHWFGEYVDLAQIERIMDAAPEFEERELAASKVSASEIPADEMSASEIPAVEIPTRKLSADEGRALGRTVQKNKFRLGLALDEAFLFYYQDALDAARALNFELTPFSPLHDKALPAGLDGIFLGGGFPELHLEALSANRTFLTSLRAFAAKGNFIYAECGGYMYLGRSMKDFAGREFPLAGIIPLQAEMTKNLQGIGYKRGVFKKDTFLGPQGTEVRGHVFHYSRVIYDQGLSADAELFAGDNPAGGQGYAKDNLVASYLHLHFAGQTQLLKHWYASRRWSK